jgi:N-methylhydantoinase A
MPICGLGGSTAISFCGGAIEATWPRLRQQLTDLAAKLDVSVDEAARGIVRSPMTMMVNALKRSAEPAAMIRVTLTLLALVAAAAMHAVALAQGVAG